MATRLHLCRPPHGIPGLAWRCPCGAGFLYRPVAARELGRVINLWVKRAAR